MPTTIAMPAVSVRTRKSPSDKTVGACFALFPLVILLIAIACFGYDPTMGAAAFVNG